jgi:hypothetical protein
MKYSIYMAGMRIGEVQDTRFKGEATELVKLFLLNWQGNVERCFPWVDKEHEMISLYPFSGESSGANAYQRFVESAERM